MMTNRFHSLNVVLESDMREDDAQALIAAISQLRGVLGVAGNVSDLTMHIAQERARAKLIEQLSAVLHPIV